MAFSPENERKEWAKTEARIEALEERIRTQPPKPKSWLRILRGLFGYRPKETEAPPTRRGGS